MKASILNQIYKTNLTLHTDLYQLTMAYAYWKNQMHEREVVFHLFYRKNPFKGNYAIACGLELAINYLQNLRFEKEDLNYLVSLTGADNLPLFEKDFLSYLEQLEFNCDIDAVEEGTLIFAHQPLIRVKGPIIQAQIIETALLNFINFSTLIATKSSRIVDAANGDAILEFGLRRAQGIDGGLTVARSAYIGGCIATSNVLAGKVYGIPVKGTHAHSWVMSFENELEAFQKYAETMPNNSVFLVDTYDTIEGVRKATEVGKWLRTQGHEMLGIRLDSGDLAELSIAAREILDLNGFPNASIVASNDLDEYRIAAVKKRGAKIDIWGVGTRLATAYDQPALGGVYKPGAIKDNAGEWQYQIKISEEKIKISNPGILQVRRILKDGNPIADVFYDELSVNKKSFLQRDSKNGLVTEFNFKDGIDLLIPVIRKGKLIYQIPDLQNIRKKSIAQIAHFKNTNLKEYRVGLEENLFQIKEKLIDEKKCININ